MNRHDMSELELENFLFDIMENGGGRGRMRMRRGTDRNDDPNDFGRKAIDDKNVRLPSYHWTDSESKHAQTVFGRRTEGCGYDYDDRFAGWNSELWREAHEVAKAACEAQDVWVPGSVRWYEVVLSHFVKGVSTYKVDPADMTKAELDIGIEICHVLAGCNVSSGHNYQVFGYRKIGEDADKVDI